MIYSHKLNGNTYQAVRNIANGVVFSIVETGEIVELSNDQIALFINI